MSDDRQNLPGPFEVRVLDQLRQVIEERRATPAVVHRPARPRSFVARRRYSLAVALALAVAGSALAATTPWSPQVGDDQRGHPSVAATPPPGDQTSALGALRRSQTDEDRGPRVQAALKALPSAQFAGVRLSSARLVQQWAGGATILLAVEHLTEPGQPTKDNALCMLISADYENANGQQTFAPSIGSKCGSLADVARGRLVMGAESGGRLQLNGIVPDDVARVEIPLRDGSTVAVNVIDNAFHLDAKVARGSYEDARIVWLDADGNRVERGV
jgi:hypothetical protein